MAKPISKPEHKFAQPVDSAWKIIPCFQSQDVRTALRFYTEVLGFQGHSLKTQDSAAPSSPTSSAPTEAQAEARGSPPSGSRSETSAHGSADANLKHASAAAENTSYEPESTAAGASALAAVKAGTAGPAPASGADALQPPEPQGPKPPQPQAIATTASATSAASAAHVSLTHAAPEPEPDFCSIYAGPRAAANLYVFLNFPSQPVKASWALVALSTAQLERLWEKVSRLRHEGAETREGDGGWKVAIVEEIGDRPWGYRQFSVLDTDGNKMTFFRFLEGGNMGDDVDDAE